MKIKIYKLNDPFESILSYPEEDFTVENEVVIKKSKDIKKSWAFPFATGHYYNVHWKEGIDFTHVAVVGSRLWEEDEAAILRFNYTDERELFQVGRFFKESIQMPYIEQKWELVDPSVCENGDYYQDK